MGRAAADALLRLAAADALLRLAAGATLNRARVELATTVIVRESAAPPSVR